MAVKGQLNQLPTITLPIIQQITIRQITQQIIPVLQQQAEQEHLQAPEHPPHPSQEILAVVFLFPVHAPQAKPGSNAKLLLAKACS